MMKNKSFDEICNVVEEENPTVNENTTIYIKVLSPTHIGGTADKHWKKGVNFFYEDNLLYEIDWKKLFQQLLKKNRLDDYLNMLSTQSENLKHNIFEEFGLEEQDILTPIAYTKLTEDAEIRMFLQNGLGKPILPGSSLKGAIRSAIFSYLYTTIPSVKEKIDKIREEEGKRKQIMETAFGKIDNNLMRFIRITDMSFEKEDFVFLSTKVMSRTRDKNLLPVWKFTEGQEGSTMLKEGEFATTYQFLAKGTTSSFQLNFLNSKSLISKLKHTRKIPSYLEKILPNNTPRAELFKWINDNTRTYVKKEIDYFRFNTKPNQKEHVYFSKLADWLESEILSQIPRESSTICVLRVGQGVGFHSITGDWQALENHTDVLEENINNKQYKTRKIVLEKDFEADDYKMYTTGFIKLYTQEEWNKMPPRTYHNPQTTPIKEALEKAVLATIEEEKKKKEAKKPKYHKGKLKKGVILDAQYIRNEKGNPQRKIFKLLIDEEGKEQEVVLSYRSDLELNTYYQVEIRNVEKRRAGTFVSAIAFKGKK